MKVLLDSGKTRKISELTLTEWREFMAEFLRKNPNSGNAWDLMACVRGPDYPSERPDMTPSESSRAYNGRRERKRKTIEIIRDRMFFGVVGGSARSHKADSVQLPPRIQWDHFDRHVERGARIVDLQMEIGE